MIDEEMAQERDVIGPADAREVPERMIEDNQDLLITIERLQQLCQMSGVWGLRVGRERPHEPTRGCRPEIVHPEMEDALAEGDGPFEREGHVLGRVRALQCEAGVDIA